LLPLLCLFKEPLPAAIITTFHHFKANPRPKNHGSNHHTKSPSPQIQLHHTISSPLYTQAATSNHHGTTSIPPFPAHGKNHKQTAQAFTILNLPSI
jgi:hypothetical protein